MSCFGRSRILTPQLRELRNWTNEDIQHLVVAPLEFAFDGSFCSDVCKPTSARGLLLSSFTYSACPQATLWQVKPWTATATPSLPEMASLSFGYCMLRLVLVWHCRPSLPSRQHRGHAGKHGMAGLLDDLTWHELLRARFCNLGSSWSCCCFGCSAPDPEQRPQCVSSQEETPQSPAAQIPRSSRSSGGD